MNAVLGRDQIKDENAGASESLARGRGDAGGGARSEKIISSSLPAERFSEASR